jgi:tetratricopeptide (TPR) repeat protein
MKRTILTGILVVAAGCGALMAQSSKKGQAQAQAQPAGPRAKSNEEAKAVNAMIQAQSAGADAIISAVDDLLTRFPDTQFKETALNIEAVAYQQKGDFARAEVIDEDVLKINPNNFQATLQLGELIVTHAGENDLDKDEKLTKAEKLLNGTIDNLKTMPKPPTQLTDAQWEGYKKNQTAEAQADLAKSALLRKNYDAAIADYKAANETDPKPAYEAYLAQAYQKAGKNDEALALCDKLLADPQINAAIKRYAQNVQKLATAQKSAPK